MKNSMIFFSEHRKNMESARNEINSNNESRNKMVEAVAELLALADVARYEGILALEWEAEKEEITDLILVDELRRIVILITEGMDSEILEDIILRRYFSRGYLGLEAAVFLMYLDICLGIQAGLSPGVIEEYIRSLVPKEIESDIEKLFAEREAKIKENIESAWEKLYDRKENLDKDSDAYKDIHLLETCLLNMSDKDVKRYFMDVETTLILLVMKVLRGDVIRKIHDNLGPTFRRLIYEDYAGIGPMRLEDASDAVSKMVQVLQRLEKEGEICIPAE